MAIFLITILMIVLTVGVHTLGVVSWMDLLSKRLDLHRKKEEYLHLFRGVLATGLVLIILHAFEAAMWAVLYVVLPAKAGLEDFQEAYYFSMITFTTLGYGDITLNHEWRALAGVEGMVGIVVFGITTATLFSVLHNSRAITKKEKDNASD